MEQTWSCPNDRELSLRAKLGTGWSYHTGRSSKKNDILSVEEQDHILTVVRRNEQLEEKEKMRIGSMMEKLENMKRLVNGNGSTQCILCGHEFRILGASAYRCEDCKLAVCSKCGVDRLGRTSRTVWFCKICSEQREVWKRSGAWFFKTMPNFVRPSGSSSTPNPLQAANINNLNNNDNSSNGNSNSNGSQMASGVLTGPAAPEIAMTWTRVGRRRSSSSDGASTDEETVAARNANRANSPLLPPVGNFTDGHGDTP